MKKVIEILEKAIDATNQISAYSAAYAIRDSKKDIVRLIDEALVVLKAPPRWETPLQRYDRTGEWWPDNGAVYCYTHDCSDKKDEWRTISLRSARNKYSCFFPGGKRLIVCANNDAGPPPDGWEPEEGKR